MRILFCCQFYAPSIGGVQEVIRQLAERLVERGHQVSVATTKLPMRHFVSLNGVDIHEFDIKGNWVSGMAGELVKYQNFVLTGDFDIVVIYAAQQWTFDALWSVLDKITFVKVLIPCGFSGMYESGYETYFQKIPDVLRNFDHLIFHASKYRDIDLAREHGMKAISVISNGASETEFNVVADLEFRARYGISSESFIFLTVGSFTGLKGHDELVRAFDLLKIPPGSHATLILNGNKVERLESGLVEIVSKLIRIARVNGVIYLLNQVVKKFAGSSASPRTMGEHINKLQPNKLVLVTDLPRNEVTQAFITADLFVFASNIEYSPLVLFESAAAGTPFLTTDVGNSVEIASWTGAGVVCPSWIDAKGYTRVDAEALAQAMEQLMGQQELLERLGAAGKLSWHDRFTWAKVTDLYEQLFFRLKEGKK